MKDRLKTERSDIKIGNFAGGVAWQEEVTFLPTLKGRARQVAAFIERDRNIIIVGGPDIPTTIYHMRPRTQLQEPQSVSIDRNTA